MTVFGKLDGSMASLTSASARPVTPPPHGFSRGRDPSNTVTRAPRRARRYAAAAPAGPPPTIATSHIVFVNATDLTHLTCLTHRDTLHGHG
jgi:hypothetical protein